MADKINKAEIKKEGKLLLNEGLTKQEVFLILSEKYKYEKTIADILRNLPSRQAIEIYGKWNYILLGLLILTTLIFLSITPSIGLIFWYGLLIYAVAKMLIKHYMWVSIFSGMAFIGMLYPIFTIDDFENANWKLFIIVLMLIIASLILPVWLANKLSPKVTERKELYKNSDGENRLKVVYEFKDI